MGIDSERSWLHLYKEQRRGIFRFSIFDRYYFKTKYAPLELLRLTKRNLLENTENTAKEDTIKTFLKKHKPNQKEVHSGNLVLLNYE